MAGAVVAIRSRLQWMRVFSETIVYLVVALLLAVPAGDGLLAAAGASEPGDGAAVPVVALIVGLARAIGRRGRSIIKRETGRFMLQPTLDLTRNPEGLLRSVRYDIERGAADRSGGFFHRLLVPTVTEAEAREAIDEWLASRRLCLLFTDIVGSTELIGHLGDERWYEVLGDHDELIRSWAAQFGGEELQKAGDGFLIVFPQAGQGVLAAREMQRDLAERRAQDAFPVHVRMGLHAGEVIRQGSELVGREVHLAARVGAVAGPDEILVSAPVRDELTSAERFRFGEPRRVELKGFPGEHDVIPVLWGDPA